ncbi:MAG: hypothetical protein HQ472_01410 [Ignavibacteria bacterium]|nr:hypothetical protein [Ignavibacteria bacterium]
MLDSLSVCNDWSLGQIQPDFLKIAKPLKMFQLPDGRSLLESQTDDPLHISITSITVRPYRVDSLSYSCDTMSLIVRGKNRANIQFSYSHNAGMSIANKEMLATYDRYTFVREPTFVGRFLLYTTDGTLHDTIRCADIRNQNEFNIKLYQHYITKPITGTLLEATPETKPHIALMKWYRNGSPLPWEELEGRSALTLLNPIPGRYHAVVMTQNWCATVTDTVEVINTGVNEPLTQPMDVEAATVDVVDITGRFLARGIKATNNEEILKFVQQLNQGFKVVRNARGEILELHAVYLGNCLLVTRR